MIRLVASAAALSDLEDITFHYLEVAGSLVAQRFNQAWLDAQDLLSDHPRVGAPRFGAVVVDPELRALLFPGFPYLIIYRVDGETVFILRVLDTSRDIPSSLRP